MYSSLLKALAMPDKEEVSFYPVRVSAAGAIVGLLEVCVQNPNQHFELLYGEYVLLVTHLASMSFFYFSF